MSEVVRFDEVHATIRAAIRSHIRDAKHPKDDVQMGCRTCLILLAIPRTLGHELYHVDLSDEEARDQDSP